MVNCRTVDGHEPLRDQVRVFSETHVRPRITDMEKSRSVQRELSQLIASQGWLGVTIDRQYGGMGLGHVAKTVIIEELARVSGAMGAMVQASQLGVAKILHFGNDEQKKTWLPAIASGECLPTIAVTESESGGHVSMMDCVAERDGDDYILNGGKVFVGNSHVGTLHGVVARTSPRESTSRGSRALSAFLVEGDRPGLSLAPQRPAMGLHGFSFGELRFNDCRIPAANLLGDEGDGLMVAYASSTIYGRPNLAAVALGIHQALVEDTIAFTQTRHRAGRPLSDLPTIRQILGRMKSRLMTAHLALYHAVHLLDQGRSCDAELFNAKLVNTESVMDSSRDAIEIHGACGLFTNRPIERYYRDAPHVIPPAGTSEIQRLRLAEIALGTYKQQLSGAFSAPLDEGPHS
jgi:acyl-CoA dehydrogenase